MKKLNNLQNEIDKKFKKNKPASLEKRQKIKKYVTGGFETEIEYLGLSIPELRSFFKKEINYEVLTIHQQFLIFQQNWFQANSWEQKALSLFWLETLSSENLLKIGKKLLTWSKIIDNWAHSDSLCSTYAKIFELDPKSTHLDYLLTRLINKTEQNMNHSFSKSLESITRFSTCW